MSPLGSIELKYNFLSIVLIFWTTMIFDKFNKKNFFISGKPRQMEY